MNLNKQTILLLDKGASSEIKKDGYDPLCINEISIWLKERSIIKKNEVLIRYEDIIKWGQSGSETFYSIFEIEYLKQKKKVKKKIVVKALSTMFPEKNLEDWTRRRKILRENNIPVSKWYYYGKGLIIEDYYCKLPEKNKFASLKEIAITLDKLGFNPLDFVRDIRMNNKGELFYIDFGFDLGEPSGISNDISINKLLTWYKSINDGIKKRNN